MLLRARFDSILLSRFMPLASAALFCLILTVSDGDTLKARCDHDGTQRQRTVRLVAIDAPERRQAYGQRARQALTRLARGKPARLLCQEKPDRYGRSLCKVMVAPASCTREPCRRTLDANLAMVTLGLAWWEPQYAREQTAQERGQYEFAQIEAKAKRAGLWREPHPQPPWQWRRAHPDTGWQRR